MVEGYVNIQRKKKKKKTIEKKSSCRKIRSFCFFLAYVLKLFFTSTTLVDIYIENVKSSQLSISLFLKNYFIFKATFGYYPNKIKKSKVIPI